MPGSPSPLTVCNHSNLDDSHASPVPPKLRFVANRRLVTLIPKQPYLDWLLTTDEATDILHHPTMADLRRDVEAFMVPEGAGETVEDVGRWIDQRWQSLFEYLLESVRVEGVWPKARSLSMFRNWFEVQVSTMVWDLEGIGPIELE